MILTDATEPTHGSLANTKIIVLDKQMNVLKELYTDANGEFTYTAQCDNTYFIRASMPEYLTAEQKIMLPKESGTTERSIALERNIKELKSGTDLAKVFSIEMIYFDLNKSDIRPDAAVDISKVVEVMRRYPNMKIEVASHTDSRASKAYNLSLSQKRAQSTLDFMVKSGIHKNRLIAKGYGENQLVNKCVDGVECSDEEHQRNRRSQFIITAM